MKIKQIREKAYFFIYFMIGIIIYILFYISKNCFRYELYEIAAGEAERMSEEMEGKEIEKEEMQEKKE